MLFFIIVLFSISCFVCGQEVHTRFGMVIGTEVKEENGGKFYKFMGIPFAIPPVGPLRFKDPVPWTEQYHDGVWEAKQTYRCVQYLVHLKKVIGKENCLHLNVYTTTLNEKANHDVVVFFHGGGFFYGAGHSQTPEYLLDANKRVVFVSVNYRLGAYGFLSTEDEVVPGNMGLKDQVVALKWIQENIKAFGGNPDNVVIAGMSAGGVSVHLHYLSPMSRDLFSRGISMSGVGLSRLVKTRDTRKDAENLAKLNNCPPSDMTEMIECLRKKHEIKMVEALMKEKLPWEDFNSYVHFGPVIEKGSSNPFLDEHPFHILRKGKVKKAPWLVSATTAEGLKPAGYFVDNYDLLQVLNDNWEDIAPYLLIFEDCAPPQRLKEISRDIKHYYLLDQPISPETRKKLIKLIGDRLYMTTIENALRLHATGSQSPVYMYIFDFRGKYSFSSFFSKTKTDLGVSHIDDMIYILRMQHFEPMEEDSLMVKRMLDIWTSFIRTGIPDTGTGIKWPSIPRGAAYKNDIPYVLIKGPNDLQVASAPDLCERQFWDSLNLDELHIAGDLYVPKHIQEQQKKGLFTSRDELKMHVIKSRIIRRLQLSFLEKWHSKTRTDISKNESQ